MVALDPAWLLSPETIAAFFDERARRNMARVKSDPAFFRTVLMIDQGPGKAGPLGPAMDPWQRADFEAMDPAWLCVAGRGKGVPPFQHCYLERGRGHSKTLDIAAIATWALLSSERKLKLVAASGGKEQAGFVRDAIDTLLRLNRWLGEALEVNNWEVKNVRTGSELSILAANENASYGHTPDGVIVDEITHWKKSGEGLWTSLASAAGKRPGCVLHVIANAGNGRGRPLAAGIDAADLGGSWQWRLREKCRVAPTWHFSRLDGPVASWITEAQLAEQRNILAPSAYQRLWVNQWQIDGANAIPMDDVLACVKLAGPRINADGLECTVGALDLSQTKHYSALVLFGINVERRRVELAYTKRWRPQDFPSGRISLRKIRADIRELAGPYNMAGLAFDPFQAELLAEDLEKEDGIDCFRQQFNIKEKDLMAKRLMDTLRERGIDLYDDPDLMRDLSRMQIVETTGKRLTVTAPEGDDVGHCDVGTAFVLGLPWAIGTLESCL